MSVEVAFSRMLTTTAVPDEQVTTSAHIITAVIGSGVLSLAWAIAQLGWIIGPTVLIAFALITWFCSSLLTDKLKSSGREKTGVLWSGCFWSVRWRSKRILTLRSPSDGPKKPGPENSSFFSGPEDSDSLTDCYRAPDPVHGKRNYTYGDAVRAYLGDVKYRYCSVAQYVNLVGITIGYTITTAFSMGAVKRSNCFHRLGHKATCTEEIPPNMIIFAVIQIVLSQLPNFHELSFLSLLAAVMSITYSSIGLALSIATIAGRAHASTSLTGVTIGVDVSVTEKIWRTFQSLGNIAFAYSYSNVLIEIQDTLKSSPPENKVMKKATTIGVSTTTLFYMLCGILGYAAFGNNAPDNFLTGFGFYEPFWLIDIGNVCIAIHLIGAYQVFAQPTFQFFENYIRNKYPENRFIHSERIIKLPFIGNFPLSPFRLVWRTLYVIITTLLAMIFPFFNAFLGLIGAMSFWPLTVYFPVEMYKKQSQVQKFSKTWALLNTLSLACLVVSILAACGSVQAIIVNLKHYKPFDFS